jgi:hypothetical protein
MICQLGTFDVENYGDLLYPIVFRHLVQKKDPTLQVRLYSLRAGESLRQSALTTESIRSLFAKEHSGLRTLVIGGGDILRTDWDLMARHYGRRSRVSIPSVRNSIDSFGARRFRARWMNYPAAGPFLIDPNDLPGESRAAYVSCGVPHDFAASEIDRVKRTLGNASFIGLRDEDSAEKLLRAGIDCEVRVAPDLTVTLSDQFDRNELACRGRKILSRFEVQSDRPLLCFQSQPYPGFDTDEILRELKSYQERRATEVVALPLGYCHGDHEFLKGLAKRSDGAIKYADVSSVFDMLAIIAASDVFVGTSLHGNITAFSFGIPHVFGPLPVAKVDGFLRVVNLPLELKMNSWSELNDKIDAAIALGPRFFAEKAYNAKQKVHRLVDDLRLSAFIRG